MLTDVLSSTDANCASAATVWRHRTAHPSLRTSSSTAIITQPCTPRRSFLVLEKRKHCTLSCTTHELNALNARLRDAANDCMVLTDQVLEVLLGKVMQQMPLLQKLVG